MYLRPHHFYCTQFLVITFSERGHRYQEAIETRRKLLEDITTNIEIGHGPDFICAVCPFFNGQVCTHPKGDEQAVRKWDAKIIKGLSLEEGRQLNITQLNKLIDKRSPLLFCVNECPYYFNNHCNPFKRNESLNRRNIK